MFVIDKRGNVHENQLCDGALSQTGQSSSHASIIAYQYTGNGGKFEHPTLTGDRRDVSSNVPRSLRQDDSKAQCQMEVDVAMHDPRTRVVGLRHDNQREWGTV